MKLLNHLEYLKQEESLVVLVQNLVSVDQGKVLHKELALAH